MVKFLIGLSLISILGVTSLNVTHDHNPSSGFILSTFKTDEYELRASSNSNEFYVTTAGGLKAQITIANNGISVITSNRSVPIETNYQENHGKHLEFPHAIAAKIFCSPETLPDGYELISGFGAYNYHHSCKKNWNDARNTCISEGGHLLVINSSDEEEAIKEEMKLAKWDDTWLGIHDLFSFRDWVTVEGIPLNELGWATWSPQIVPNPDNYGGNQHCVRLLREGGMDDIECSSMRNFICKITCDTRL